MNGGAGTVIRTDALTRRFGAVTAVDQVSFDLQENEFFTLLGPSGCGKTTLLRLIAGFEVPDSGHILLDGQDITHVKANRRPVNMMFQSYALFPHMTVRKNISYGLEMEGIAAAERDRRVGEIIDTTHLEDIAERKPDQLSGGQKQRVALARALIKRPRVLLLDEPLGALDKRLREQMKLELKRLQHDVGITFVVVTHDQDEALVMADRIALMRDGKIVQCGEPRQLYEQPENRFVASFIGDMNMFEARLDKGRLVCPALGPLVASPLEGAADGTLVTVAVRPERMTLSRPGDANGSRDGIEGQVADIAYHGQDVNVYLTMGETAIVAVAKLAASNPLVDELRIGEKVRCTWSAEHARVFNE